MTKNQHAEALEEARRRLAQLERYRAAEYAPLIVAALIANPLSVDDILALFKDNAERVALLNKLTG